MSIILQAAKDHKRIHFIGIGGVMMNALALEIKRRGAVVTGTDKTDSETVKKLRLAGIPVHIGHDASAVEGADLIVRNAAIHDDFPDIKFAREHSIPILERPDVLGQLMDEYPRSVAVSGTHGKSTTTGMITTVLKRYGYDPTVFIGATLSESGEGYILGDSNYFVAEACEYCASFLYLHPFASVILNIEADHLDFYSGIDQIVDTFEQFALNTHEDGIVVINADNRHSELVAQKVSSKRRTVTFGLTKGDCHAENLEFNKGYASFDVVFHGEKKGHIVLSVPGEHNVSNALAAAALLFSLGVDPIHICSGLSFFGGMNRRFNKIGSVNGADIYDDYAHHPDELAATLRTASMLGAKRVLCLFQPHTYTRTKALLTEFAETLENCDKAILTDIYSAREINTVGISSEDIVKLVPGSEYIPTLEECIERLPGELSEGDILLVCGAGDVGTVARKIVSLFK